MRLFLVLCFLCVLKFLMRLFVWKCLWYCRYLISGLVKVVMWFDVFYMCLGRMMLELRLIMLL